ncbi:ATPase involved in DNA repair [Photobacterium sp. SKA34]|uniref:LysM peptidoglycan-binding domain-containing protein n=1 Tax=Photobacterium sp. SKA34 TaxID=121723 RepID=UPI00006AEB38|nr:LysM domain-containing protein [Photobacterium sp. SKA34]EAR57231.1 ATPase involved in DNA repair [Photobacterium sp. SKA34]
MTTYTITKGDCLSLIALRFNTTLEELQKLNSEQLRNVDLISEGEVINISNPEVRIALPKAPQKPANGNSTCSHIIPNFVDILYVPAHPKTGKKTWYAVTQEAKNKILEEKGNLENTIIPNNKEAIFNNINKLGVLSKFETKPHDQFLSKEQKRQYHDLLLHILVVKSGAINFYKDGKDEAIVQLAKQHNIDIDDFITGAYTWEKLKHSFDTLFSTTNNYLLNSAVFISEYNNAQVAFELRQNAIRKAHHKLVETLEEKIASIERIAEGKAQTKKSDDGTNFVFDEKSQVFTSKKQVDIRQCIETMHDKRKESDEDLIYSSPSYVDKYYESFWNDELLTANIAVEKMKTSPRAVKPSWLFAKKLQQLNNYGLVIKEQCLSKEQLIGIDASKKHFGPDSLVLNPSYKDWRERKGFFSNTPETLNYLHTGSNDQTIIDKIYVELQGGTGKDATDIANEASICNWAYYPTLALIGVVNLTLKKFNSDIKLLLNGESVSPDFLTKLIWIKKVAIARKEILQKIGNQNALKGNSTFHIAKEIEEEVKKQKLTVIWDESKHKVQRKKLGSFINKAGLNDLQICECSFISDGIVFWVRAPHWYMPEKNKENFTNVHVKNITANLKAIKAEPSNENTFEEALESLKKPTIKGLDLSKQIQTLSKNNTFWSDNYHYEAGQGPKNGHSLYVADAQAQFFRFSSEASAKINTPVDNFSGFEFSKEIGLGGEIKGNLTLLSAQMTFSTWLPLNDKNRNVASKALSKTNQPSGYALKIPYFRKTESADFECQEYDAGEVCIKITGQVYGLAAATCQLGTSLSFGLGDSEGTVGIKGSAISIPDYNTHAGQKESGASAAAINKSNLNGVMESRFKADAFVGVEAGGSVTGEVLWRPPSVNIANGSGNIDHNKLLPLGKVSASASVNYGIGAHFEFRLTYQNGCFYIITIAKLIVGPGCSGKVAIELNPENADRFITCCLNILNQSGFRKIAIFGDVDSNDENKDFMALNLYLTLAIALGLSLGEVMLLPLSELKAHRDKVLKKDYAPLLSEQILRTDIKDRMQAWIVNLPPETLSGLLNCLISYQDKAADNTIQVVAILQVLRWLKTSPNGTNQNQFERTLVLMNGDIESQQSPLTQWNSFTTSWLRLAKFIIKHEEEGGSDSYDFNRSSAELCKNMSLYKLETNHILDIKTTEYKCFYNGDDLDEDTKKIRKKLEKRIQTFKKIAWSTDEI